MRVSVVIPTWNGAALLAVCLEALEAQTARDFEVLVVDNGSTDDSPAMVAAHFPWVQLIGLPENRGFSAAVNAGIAKARGDVVALLNNDTRADPRWVATLASVLAARPEIGFCASKMLSMADPRRLDNAGIDYRVDGFALTRGARELDGPAWSAPREVFGACGGAAAYRRALLEDVGTFDERFFAYYEDVDLSFRARLRGWRCLYVPDAVVLHRQGASTVPSVRDVLVPRNRLLTWIKNMPAPLLRRRVPAAMRGLVAAAYSDARLGRAGAHLAGIAGALRWLRSVLADRAQVQRGRRVSLGDLEAMLTPR
jgi:GT2 family glycosyltransferase